MKMATSLERAILVILILLLFAPLAFADIIWLKDGGVLRGRIVEESEQTIVIEGADWWRVLGRSEIEKITYQVETVMEPREYVKVERVRDPVIITQASPGVIVLAVFGALFLILLVVAAI